jgi:ribosomal protein S18 acetylase RimI-like enzyme
VVGYGWMDTSWGEGEILLAVSPRAEGKGVGTYILDQLAREAQTAGLNYIHNVIRPTNPRGAEVKRWLEARGFLDSGDGRLKRRVSG